MSADDEHIKASFCQIESLIEPVLLESLCGGQLMSQHPSQQLSDNYDDDPRDDENVDWMGTTNCSDSIYDDNNDNECINRLSSTTTTTTTTTSILESWESRNWFAILFGQGIAFIAASMNAISYTLIHQYSIHTQLFLLFWMYILLSFQLLWSTQKQERNNIIDNNEDTVEDDVFNNRAMEENSINSEDEIYYTIPFLPTFVSKRIPLRIQWWKYFLISILDVFPNFLTLLSYRYTSLTSTTLLGSLTVPSTMFFCWVILGKQFHRHHYIGVFLCVLGGTLTVYMDVGKNEKKSTTNSNNNTTNQYYESIIGDLLAVIAALVYGLGDTVAEYAVKRIDRYEYLGMLGIFGTLLTVTTFPWIEFHALYDLFCNILTKHPYIIGFLLVLYVLSVLLYYISAAKFLVSSDATLLNLSMQSVNLWAFFYTLTVYRDNLPPPILFAAAVGLVFSGVFMYERQQICRFGIPRRSDSQVEIVQGQDSSRNYQTLISQSD